MMGDNMEEITFSSQKDLYNRILPALRSKKKLLHLKGFKNVSEKDIWDYLRINVWVKKTGLELCELVDDVLHAEDKEIIIYCHDKYMKDGEYLEEGFILPKLKDE